MKFLLDLFSDFWLLYFIFLIFILLKITARAFPVLMNLLKNIRGRDLLLVILLAGIGLMLRIRYSSHINLDAYGWGYIEDALAIKDTLCLRFPTRFVLSSAFHIPGYPFLISLALLFVENIRLQYLRKQGELTMVRI